METAPLEVFKSWSTILFSARGGWDGCECRAGHGQQEEGLGYLGRPARAQRQDQGLGQGGEAAPGRQGVRGSGGSENRGNRWLNSEWRAPQAVCCPICSLAACWRGLVSPAAGVKELILDPWPKPRVLRKAGCRGCPTKI